MLMMIDDILDSQGDTGFVVVHKWPASPIFFFFGHQEEKGSRRFARGRFSHFEDNALHVHHDDLLGIGAFR